MNNQQLTAWLEATIAQLHTPHATTQQRTEAEASLLQFQHSAAAWTVCLQLLVQATASPQLLLFAAQSLRSKANAEGSQLPQQHLEQLGQALLPQLARPGIPTAILQQLCLTVSALAALMPQDMMQGSWLQSVCSTLPWKAASKLLRAVAEEGCSDWRHVTVPGLTSSEKLSWATATRDRFRCWSEDALALLLTWLQQQQQQDTQALMCLLEGLTAWVKLGALHNVPEQLAQAVAQAGLVHIQTSAQEVVSAAAALLSELVEYSPEQLLQSLQPHMLQVAQAAVQAAVQAASATPPDLLHAAAWVSVVSAYCAAVPQQVLAEEDEGAADGQSLRQAMLQVASLPHMHSMQPICLPAIHVWSAMLGQGTAAASTARLAAAGCVSGGQSRASTAAEEAAADLVSAEDSGETPVTPVTACKLHAGTQRTCQHLLLHTAWNCMCWQQTAEGCAALAGVEVQTAVHELFLAICCVLGQQQYLQGVLHVWAGQGPPVVAHTPSVSAPQQLSTAAAWQQQDEVGGWDQDPALRQLSEAIAAAPAQLRLHVAVDMAAAASVQPRREQPAEEDADSNTQSAQSSIAGLLSHAAGSLGQPGEDNGHLVHSFCMAVQVWSAHLAHHFATSPAEQGTADMLSLLQLLLAIASQSPTDPGGHTRAAAAAAVRALTSAALHAGWDKLYLAAPLLLKAVEPLAGVDSADQALFAALAMCLAADAPQQQLQELRSRSVEQLVQPAVRHLQQLLQQLQSGTQQWAALGKQADSCLCQHLVRVRVVLEAAWQRHEQQRKQAAAGCSHERNSQSSDGLQELDAPDPGVADEQLCSSFADLGSNPVAQLVVDSLYGQLHALVVQHGACRKFLAHYAKLCSKVLKLQPLLLLKAPQRAQFLEVCVLGLVRPGGCALADPLLAAVKLCCQQQQTGSPLLVEAATCINQAFVRLWSLPEAVSLQQPQQGDAHPDLADAVLKLAAAYAGSMSILQPSNSQAAAILPHMVSAASACAGCCHKKVGSAALNALIAVSTAVGAQGSQPLQQLVAQQGALIAYGAFRALLVPSPLPRLQKVSSVLLELAALGNAVDHNAGNEETILQSWLAQATQAFMPSALLSAAEAADLAAACTAILYSSTTQQADAAAAGSMRVPASRSFAAARRLKKRLRDFAERHMRKSHASA